MGSEMCIRDRATGELSIIVVFAQLMGTIARVFTTLTETNDPLLFWGFALATIFNAVIAIQVIMYWNGNEQRRGKNASWSNSRWQNVTGAPVTHLPYATQRAGATKTD